MNKDYHFKKMPFKDIITENNIVYPVERIAKLYDYYIENLKRLSQEKEYVEFKWYSLDEINVAPDFAERKFTHSKNDSYLINMEDQKELARDIMKNGTFWPLTILHAESIPNEVFKGRHRIVSAKLLQQDNEWNDRKFLAIDLKKPIADGARLQSYADVKLTNGNNMYYIPTLVWDQEIISENTNWEAMEKEIILHGGKLIDHDIVEIPLKSYKQVIKLLTHFSMWIGELNHMSKKVTGQGIEPSPVINNIEQFNKWIGEK